MTILRNFVVFLLILSVVFCLVGCSASKTHESIYEEYMQAMLNDTHSAQKEYVFFRNTELESLAFESEYTLYDYQILSWEQLSDSLWVVTVMMHSSFDPEPRECINFVGIIDGEYWVIPGILGLPDELKKGVDFSKFKKYESGINPEDILN